MELKKALYDVSASPTTQYSRNNYVAGIKRVLEILEFVHLPWYRKIWFTLTKLKRVLTELLKEEGIDV